MKTIYKYPIAITDSQTIPMPEGAVILTSQMQGFDLCLWVMVDTVRPLKDRSIEVFGTGNPIVGGVNRAYIGTAQDRRGLVWHVFELADASFSPTALF